MERRELDLDGPSAPPPNRVDARAYDEPAKPRVEPLRVAKRRQAPPCLDEAVLNGIAGEVVVPQDQPSRAIQATDRRARRTAKAS